MTPTKSERPHRPSANIRFASSRSRFIRVPKRVEPLQLRSSVPGRTSKVGKRLPLLRAERSGFWTARRIRPEITWPNRLPEVLARVSSFIGFIIQRNRSSHCSYSDAVIYRCRFSIAAAAVVRRARPAKANIRARVGRAVLCTPFCMAARTEWRALP